MKKSKNTKKKATAKTRKPAATTKAQQDPKKKPPRDDLCVFAFRLTAEERNSIHKAAGPAKASKFARNLLVAAASNDEAAVKTIMNGIQTA